MNTCVVRDLNGQNKINTNVSYVIPCSTTQVCGWFVPLFNLTSEATSLSPFPFFDNPTWVYMNIWVHVNI